MSKASGVKEIILERTRTMTIAFGISEPLAPVGMDPMSIV